MTATTLTQETYLPTGGGDELAEVFGFLRAHDVASEGVAGSRYALTSGVAGDQVELPAEVHRVLLQVVEAMREGLAVTVVPRSQTLTTQQGADLLGVSRPTLIKALDAGRIPFERVGVHRRIQLRDLLAYREQRREDQYAALEATAVAIDEEDDVDSALANLREARRAVAARRRGAASS